MLQFFRKYQKIVFGITAFFIVLSFLFFGPVSQGLGPNSRIEDMEVAVAIDGSSIKHSDIQQLSAFLAMDMMDEPTANYPINFLNDGVIKTDILKSSLAQDLFDEYIEQMVPIMQEKLKRAKLYTPYQHPQFSAISAEHVWKQFSPKIWDKLQAIQKSEHFSKEVFCHFVDLYLLQSEFSPQMLQRVLTYQQQRFNWLTKDPRLSNGDFHLFGFQTASDWFGKEFLDLTSQLILNTARLAKQEGLFVSRQEVEQSLVLNFEKALKKSGYDGQEPFDELFNRQINMLGLSFDKATQIWENILLFRNYFAEKSVHVNPDDQDELSAEELLEEAVIVQYEMDPGLKLFSMQDFTKLQLYLDAVFLDAKGLALPTKMREVDTIEETHPSLVYQNYEIEVAKAEKSKLALQITLRQLIDYELDPTNWSALSEDFIALNTSASSRDERYECLEKLEPAVRKKLDQFVTEKMLNEHPEWVQHQLNEAKPQSYRLQIAKEGALNQLPEIKNHQEFINLLASVTLGETFEYSEDQKTFFLVTVKKRDKQRSVFTFAEAQEQGALEQMCSSFLQTGYPQWRKKAPASFQDAEGNFKPLHEVKEELCFYAMRDHLKKIDRSYVRQGGKIDWKEGFGTKEFYLAHRFSTHLHQVRKDLADKGQSPWIAKVGQEIEPIGQWVVHKKELRLPASRLSSWHLKEVVRLGIGEFSSLSDLDRRNAISFFQLKNKTDEPFSHGRIRPISKKSARRIARKLLMRLHSGKNMLFITKKSGR